MHRELSEKSKESRLRLAKHLIALPDHLVPPSQRGKEKPSPFSLLPLFILATSKLLNGPPKDVTLDVWRASLKALIEGLKRHHVQRGFPLSSEISVEAALKLSQTGLQYVNRSIRLVAG